MKRLVVVLLLLVSSGAFGQAGFFGASVKQGAQGIVDKMNEYGDFNISVHQSSNGKGGVFEDTGITDLADADNDEVLAWKTFGNNPPATSKNLLRTGTIRTPSTSTMWYKDFCTTNVVPQLRIRSEYDKYVRIYNGQLSDSYYETNTGSITTITHPVDIIYWMQFNWGTEASETTGDLRWDGSVVQWAGNGIAGGTVNSTSNFALGDNMIRLRMEADGDVAIFVNGTAAGTATTRTFSTTERRLGTSSHVLTHNARAVFMKFGEFTSTEIAKLTYYSNLLWPRTGTYPYPYRTNHWQNTSSQWNGTLKQWEPGRNLTSVFQGGNGTEGTHEYFWIYWNSADDTLFPVNNKLDEQIKIPGSIHLDAIGTGDVLNSVSIDGVTITSGAVNFNTDAATTATDLCTNVNAHQTRYWCRASGNASQLFDTRNLFDTNAITFSATGFTPTTIDNPVGEYLNRTTYAAAGQIFNGIAGNGSIQVMRISRWYDSNGYAGDPWQTKWHLDNIP